MYILNRQRFHEAMEQRGFSSIEQLSRFVGVHRNTIHYYLSAVRVIPDGLERLLDALSLSAAEAIFRELPKTSDEPLETIAPLVDLLAQAESRCCYVLFGSQAKGTGRKYSDFDIGVYAETGIDHDCFIRLMGINEDWEEQSPVLVDLVNLRKDEEEFLMNIAKDAVFLGGSFVQWMDFCRRYRP
jgi:predicted nucleotidyltransferase